MTVTPESLAKSGNEDGEQSALFCYAAIEKRTEPLWALLFAIPNGGKRDKITASNLKREGVKAGIPDVMLPVARAGWHGLFIELKRPKNKELKKAKGTVQDVQEPWHIELSEQGYCVAVCYGWLEAANYVSAYLRMEPCE